MSGVNRYGIRKEKIIRIVRQSILKLICEFKKYPDIFLTEDDIRSWLYTEILKHIKHMRRQTKDGSISIPLHCEVRWYGRSGRLRYRSDIVLLDVASLEVKNRINLPSKGYAFNLPYAIIELKLRRINGQSDNKFYSAVKKEIEKAIEIQQEIGGYVPIEIYLLIFDKKGDIEERLCNIEADRRIQLKYVVPEVEEDAPPKRNNR